MTMELLLHWHQIVGGTLSKYTHLHKITFDKYAAPSKGTLHIVVPHHAFGFEIQLQQNVILQKIHHYMGHHKIDAIKIRVDPKAFADTPCVLTPEKCENQDHLLCLEDFKDDPLKEALAQLGRHLS